MCEIGEGINGTLEYIQFRTVLSGDGEAKLLIAAGHITLEAAAGKRSAKRGIARCSAVVADEYSVVIVGGFIQKSMLKAVVEYRHVDAAGKQIGGHAPVVLKPYRKKKFCFRLFRLLCRHGLYFAGIKKAALLIDKLYGIGKFHIFDFDQIIQRVDAAHLIMGPPAPFSVGEFQAVVAAELIRSGTGGNEFIRLVSPEKGQQVRLTGTLNLRFGCIGHG